MAYLEDLNNIATILLQDYANKNLVPEWFSVNMKTLLSKNITLEDWNNVQWYLKNVAAENEAVFKFCQNLNSALTNFEANVDSAISQAATNALNTATSYTNTKIAEQEAMITTGYTALSDRIDNVDMKYLSLSQNIVKDFNTQIQEVEDMIDKVESSVSKAVTSSKSYTDEKITNVKNSKEIWTFTLEDGTVITKEVLIS